MAYREFYQPIENIPADYSGLERGIATLFSGMAQRQKDKRDLADRFQYDLKGGFESDQKILGELAKNVVNRAVQAGGSPDLETKKLMTDGKVFAETSTIQKKRAEDLNKRIDDLGIRNKYYDTTNDYKSLQQISEPEVNFQNRGAILDSVEKNIGSARNFKKDAYIADFVKDRQRSYKEKTTGNPDSKSTRFDQSTFWDDKTGKPGVTDEHAVDLLKSDEMLDHRYTLELQDQMLSEIDKMKASGDERNSWMKDKTDAEIQNELIADPKKNTINSTAFGDRKREMAKKDLAKFNAIDTKISYEKKDGDGSNGPVKNDSIGHSNTFFSDNTSPSGKVSGPGGLLMIKKGVSAGKPITIEADSGKSFDYSTGKNSKRNRGKFNLTGYQLGAYTPDGNLVPIQANTPEEMETAIKNLPDETFRKLGPELKVALSGYSLNDSKMLGDIATKSFDLADQIGEEKDPEKRADLEYQLSELNRLKQSFNVPGVFDEDIIMAAQKNGIKQVRNDQLLLADKSDLDKVKTITGGLDLTKQDNWSPEMKQAQQLYKSRWEEVNKKTIPSSDTERKSEPKKAKKTYPLPAGKPRVVKQGEFTYTWDENAGEYR